MNQKYSSLAEREDQLHTALREEVARENINSSKFRAVAQRMDYDGFRQMVLGANLKSTKAGEYQHIVTNTRDRFNIVESGGHLFERTEDFSFRGRWRKAVSSLERWNLLQSEADSLEKHIDFEVYAEILKVLCSLETIEVEKLREFIERLKTLKDFRNLNKFLSRKEREGLSELLEKLGMADSLQDFNGKLLS